MRKHALLRSAFIVVAALAIALAFAACSSGGGGGGGSLFIAGGATMTKPSGYELEGVLMLLENMSDFVQVGATVQVNGEDLTPFIGAYIGSVTPVAPGNPVKFTIGYNGVAVDQTLTMPTAVAITAPASTAKTAGITVSWAASTEPGETVAPANVIVQVSSTYTANGESYSKIVSFASGSLFIPADTFDQDLSSIRIDVGGVAFALVTAGGVASGSSLMVANLRSVTVSRI